MPFCPEERKRDDDDVYVVFVFFITVVVRRMQSEGLLSRTVSGLEFSGNILSSNTLNKAKFIQTNE